MPKLAEQDVLTAAQIAASTKDWADDLQLAQRFIAPAWPLRDMVAVNPFEGVADHDFLQLRNELAKVRDGDLLPPVAYFQKKFEAGELSIVTVEQAFHDCKERYAERLSETQWQDVSLALSKDAPATTQANERTTFTIAESLSDENVSATGIDWPTVIVNEISRFCASYFDQGQASWKMPNSDDSLFAAWRSFAQIDRRLEMKGMKGFRAFAASLPTEPVEAVAALVQKLDLNESRLEFLMTQLMSIPGWAAYVKYCDRGAAVENSLESQLVGLLAIRLAYDVALVHCGIASDEDYKASLSSPLNAPQLQPSESAAVRFVLQTAVEYKYRNELLAAVTSEDAGQTEFADEEPTRKSAQMVFCIDVRSEPLRRQLEAVSHSVETFGFAGFFGLAAQHVQIGEQNGTPQCPVLLSPGVTARDTCDHHYAAEQSVNQEKGLGRSWKSFQSAVMAGFAFVESCGLAYTWKLLADTLRIKSKSKQIATTPKFTTSPESMDELDVADRAAMAQSILKNLGLTSNFARLVVFCGHGSETKNNPLAASLDCGACGGHSGEVNARLAAGLLNDSLVRKELSEQGIEIPSDTHFTAGLHNTTTDEITFPDEAIVPSSHSGDMTSLIATCAAASELARAERAVRFVGADPSQLEIRSRDWSEVRPEWGLAGNAAFVVAPRSTTQAMRLGGRVFLHSYQHENDEDYKTLELIMTAPMVVTNWINMQYFASTVDNKNYGCGNKALHNVVAGVGVLEGNAGDLRTGLPIQSLHDGRSLHHEPLRLQVFIDAPANRIQEVLMRHSHVRDLVVGGWLHLYCIDGPARQYTPQDTWEEVDGIPELASA
ncbi:MAG: DUF2309 domain-containing protein [Aureliella sp.]